MNRKVNFGFKTVDPEQKEPLVREVFNNVASQYDLMNNLMSLGIHHWWKKKFIEKLPHTKRDLIDVAAGTADIARLYQLQALANFNQPKIVVCDINIKMLLAGRNKLIDNNILTGIEFTCANAEALPFADNSFDYYTIAFGLRNIVQTKQALLEAKRVLRPGGKFLCLEFSKPTNHQFNKLYDYYSFKIIPKLGGLVSNNEAAYRYLVESIRKFYNQQELLILIKDCGFIQVNYENLTGGITAIHWGYKI